jgi:hypothetical protein
MKSTELRRIVNKKKKENFDKTLKTLFGISSCTVNQNFTPKFFQNPNLQLPFSLKFKNRKLVNLSKRSLLKAPINETRGFAYKSVIASRSIFIVVFNFD